MGVGCRRPGWNSSCSARCGEGASRIGFRNKTPRQGQAVAGRLGASPEQLYGLGDNLEHVPYNRKDCDYFGGGIVIDHKQMPPPRHHAAESGIGIIGTRAMTVKKNGAASGKKNSGHQATCAWWP